MKFFRIILINIFLSLVIIPSFGQGTPIGAWRDHLPYNKVIAVAEAENRIYAATPYCLFYFDKNEYSVHRLNKVNGLSDVRISAIHYNQQNKTLVIAYENTNIDLLKNDNILNIPDIKLKSMPGKKTINNITSTGNTVYLACSFGIVNLNISKNEIKDTYIIGPNGGRIEVNNIAINNNKIYAASVSGIFYADINSPFLANYSYWNLLTTLQNPNANYKNIGFLKNKLIVCKDRGTSLNDTLFVFDNNVWNSFDTSRIKNIHINYDNLIVTYDAFINVYNDSLKTKYLIYIPNQTEIYPWDAVLDKDGFVWVGDERSGLFKTWGLGFSGENIKPNGPSSKDAYSMKATKNALYVVPGGIDLASWGNEWMLGIVNIFKDENWSSIDQYNNSGLDTISDLTDIAVDPYDENHLFASSWRNGVLEFNNNKLVTLYNENNSSLQPLYLNGNRFNVRTGGVCFDKDGNLWVTNSTVQNALSIRFTSGTWKSFNVGDIVDNDVSAMMNDKNNNKWMLVRGNKIAVFNADENGIHKAYININRGNDLATNEINCFNEDLDGQIWIGTDKGIKVIYNPEEVFNTVNGSESTVAPQTILVEYGGYAQHLLEFEAITSIAIDGANRKWIGTSKAGVFLMSSDGTTQLLHFTTENSPLLSNTIVSIAISPNTGEVFFGTQDGIVSYKGTATLGTEKIENPVYAYPNPVRPEYNGKIGIKGLTRDANVKITDVYGNLVFNSVAYGGQAVWDGKNFSGQRVATGVYKVFCTNVDGTETVVTKILFVN